MSFIRAMVHIFSFGERWNILFNLAPFTSRKYLYHRTHSDSLFVSYITRRRFDGWASSPNRPLKHTYFRGVIEPTWCAFRHNIDDDASSQKAPF